MLNMNEVRRIVVKVGSSTLTYDNGKPNIRRIERLVRTISDLQNRGFEMVLVSSGAVAVGTAKLGLAERPKELSVKQAAAAVGQCELMHIYDKMFLEYGINVAQILLTRENIVDDDQRANIHNTFTALTKIGVVPIINENDTVATAELKHIENFGDNDTLSAVGQRRHLTAAFCNARNALFVQHQTVDQAVVQTCRSAVFNINPVCRDDLVRMCHQRVRNGENAAVFVVRAELRHRVLGAAGVLGNLHERSHYIFTS